MEVYEEETNKGEEKEEEKSEGREEKRGEGEERGYKRKICERKRKKNKEVEVFCITP